MIIIIKSHCLLIYNFFLQLVNRFQERKILLVHRIFQFDSIQVSHVVVKEGEKRILQNGGQQWLFLYTASGQGQLTNEGKQIHLAEGASLLIDTPCELVPSSNRMSLFLLTCDKEKVCFVPFEDFVFVKQPPAKMVPIWKELMKLKKSTTLPERCRFHTLIWNMLAMVTDQMEVDSVEEAIKYIQNNLHEAISVAELSDRVGMTASSFARAFRKKVGVSPKEFMNQERIKLAKKLMIQEKGLTLKEIALQVGLQDEFYFSRLFKKKEEVPPTIFMKRAQKRVAVISQLLLQDHLLALGIQPVAAPAYPTEYPLHKGLPSYLFRELEGTILLNAENSFNRDEVLRAQPDVIIKTPLHQSPEQSVLWTQQVDVHQLPFQPTWAAYLQKIAYIVGEEQKVEPIIRKIHQLELEARESLYPYSRFGKWVIIWVRSNEIRLYGKTGHAFIDLFFDQLGFEPDDHVPTSGYKVIRMEELANIDPDHILILWSHEKDVQKITTSKYWNKLKAVKNRNVYYPNSIEWDPWGPIGRQHMIQQLVHYFVNQGKMLV